jgi:hypothetical protein
MGTMQSIKWLFLKGKLSHVFTQERGINPPSPLLKCPIHFYGSAKLFFYFSTRFLLRPDFTSLKHLSGWENEKNQIISVYCLGSCAVSVIDGCSSVRYYSSNLHSIRIIKPITVCNASRNHI